ncbi:MAG: hypothetical protein KGH94_01515 [Candidatus Micrarchaeota archaeon]|nr:hypothetical protein [Candidatus Micrarchaeota archaeon]
MGAKSVEQSAAPKRFSRMKWLRFVQEAKIPIGDAFQDYTVALRNGDPIHKSEIPDHKELLKEGRAIATSTCSGSAAQMRCVATDPRETVIVEEQEFAFGSDKRIKYTRFLVTYDINTCVALAAYNPRQKAGLLAHAFDSVNMFDAVEKAANLLHASTAVLFGGRSADPESAEMVFIAEALLARHSIKVVGRDTLRNYRQSGIGIDTRTGEVFHPMSDLGFTGIDSYLLRPSLPLENGKRSLYRPQIRPLSVASIISNNLDSAME